MDIESVKIIGMALVVGIGVSAPALGIGRIA